MNISGIVLPLSTLSEKQNRISLFIHYLKTGKTTFLGKFTPTLKFHQTVNGLFN